MGEVRSLFTRPNGKVYRPRKPGLWAAAWDGEYESGVIVFGTLDADEARDTATSWARYWFGTNSVKNLRTGWFRDGYLNGERTCLRMGRCPTCGCHPKQGHKPECPNREEED